MNGVRLERAIRIDCGGDGLLGVLTGAAGPVQRGVLIVVGGPQYRVGSHRQFTLLARRLAGAGYPTLRFDYRGMGDSEGEPREFDTVTDDIDAAIAAFLREVPGLQEIVLWGLCDGGSAVMIYGGRHPQVRGLALLNPWVRTEASLAQARVGMYYPHRLIEPAFWKKLVAGQLHVFEALRGLAANVRSAVASAPNGPNFLTRMCEGAASFGGPMLLVLSGDDLVARELLETAARDPAWGRVLALPQLSRADIPHADHTFSRVEWRDAVERHTLAWLAAW